MNEYSNILCLSEYHKMIFGFLCIIIVSCLLSLFAKDHRPFIETFYPFGVAYLSFIGFFSFIVLLVRWFS